MTRKIKFSDDYEKKWSPSRKIDYLEKGWSSSNEALKLMQEERNNLLAANAKLVTLNENAQEALDIQKAINLTAITENNERMQRDAAAIQELKAKAKVG